jgi:hypothetical protein
VVARAVRGVRVATAAELVVRAPVAEAPRVGAVGLQVVPADRARLVATEVLRAAAMRRVLLGPEVVSAVVGRTAMETRIRRATTSAGDLRALAEMTRRSGTRSVGSSPNAVTVTTAATAVAEPVGMIGPVGTAAMTAPAAPATTAEATATGVKAVRATTVQAATATTVPVGLGTAGPAGTRATVPVDLAVAGPAGTAMTGLVDVGVLGGTTVPVGTSATTDRVGMTAAAAAVVTSVMTGLGAMSVEPVAVVTSVTIGLGAMSVEPVAVVTSAMTGRVVATAAGSGATRAAAVTTAAATSVVGGMSAALGAVATSGTTGRVPATVGASGATTAGVVTSVGGISVERDGGILGLVAGEMSVLRGTGLGLGRVVELRGVGNAGGSGARSVRRRLVRGGMIRRFRLGSPGVSSIGA